MDNFAPNKIASLFAPNPNQFPREGYTGLEFRYGVLTFRPAEFKLEGMLIGALLVYFIIAMVGQSRNLKKASKWVTAHGHLYHAQFSKPGLAVSLLADGPTDYLLFSTGRRAVAHLHTIISFLPRHDLVQAIYEFGMQLVYLDYSPTDKVVLDFKLSSSVGFVWAIVSKLDLKTIRNDRFDIVYFTKTSENSHLPQSLSLMAESADLSETIFKSTAGAALCAKLADPAVNKYFRSLIITDQPIKRPINGPVPPEKKESHLILTLDLPSTSELAVTEPLVRTLFDLIDFLDTKAPPPDQVAKRLTKARTELDAQLTKESKEPSADEKEEAENAKRAAKRAAEEKKFSELTPDQQRKHEEKERKRTLLKAQKKMGSRP